MDYSSKIYIAGHNGMVGSALCRILGSQGYNNLLFKKSSELNLINQKDVDSFFQLERPEYVIIAAAKVGGILANNNFKANFIYENITIQSNIIHGSYLSGVKNLIFLGSSCIYPKKAKQPIKESYFMTGPLEETNDAYSIAKIAGAKMCMEYSKQYKVNYKTLMPANMFGVNDNYDLKSSHFFSALTKKIHIAKIKNKKIVTLWGNGKAKRELLYVEDFADACVFFMRKKTKENFINIGSGLEKTIEDFAKFIMKKLNVKLKIKYDLSKPNGMMRKKLDLTIANKYGWRAKTKLDEAFKKVYSEYLKLKL